MHETIKSQAVFLDRDGTIIHDEGYLKDPEKIRLFDDSIDSLRKLQKDYELFVVTNQSGVAKGLTSETEVNSVNSRLDHMLREAGIYIREWYVCIHDKEDNCECRKPKPYFLLKASEDYGINLKHSWMLGDHPSDVETALACGAKGIYLLTGHGAKHLDELGREISVFHTLTDAVRFIMEESLPGKANFCSISDGAEIIRKGGLVAFPTETVYGLGADVFNPAAVENIFRLKGRPLFNPLIAHIPDRKMLERLTDNIPESAGRLMDAFWPGPLTIVFNKKAGVPDIVTGGNSTVAVRMPSHPLALKLIRLADTPVAAPSANAFGRTSPTTAFHVIEQLGTEGYGIIDGGASRVGVESTVISLAHEIPQLLRPGGISKDQIEAVIGPVSIPEKTVLDHPEAPGMLESHYSPVTPMFLSASQPSDNEDPQTGLLLFKPEDIRSAGPVEILSKSADTEEAAVNLYAAMRRLDSKKLKRIIAYPVPETGAGHAVNDRIKKAVKGSSSDSNQT